ncbi:MAG: serine O-acetyltransferase EpsC, partial [Segetibacter sp.]
MTEETFIKQLLNKTRECLMHFPDKETAEDFIDELFQFLFTSPNQRDANVKNMTGQLLQLQSTFEALVFETYNDADKARNNGAAFFKALPSIYEALLKDAEAILQTDPAAKSLGEVMAAYPGFYATVVYRLSHQLWKQGITLLPRLFSEYAHSKTGIDIHPGARIGVSFSIDHGTGIVIGETTDIGANVKIYQGVTLGALNVSKDKASTKRHPTIEENVIIYSGATILGGDTTIGKGSVIGGNVWLTNSVPSNSVVYHKSEIHVKDNHQFTEP